VFDEAHYRDRFKQVTGLTAFGYQTQVARLIGGGKNVVLRAPTGAGKTWAVLVPFFSDFWQHKPARLIYALPLRTLAQGVYEQARSAAKNLNLPIEPIFDASGSEKTPPYVTLQTGEQPDDPFFARGRIIVTTYDQVLSGLLEGPYGLSKRLHNINAAAVAGALVVFDEFHLMPPNKAFLTAIAGMHLFRDLCQSVWMTATATEALQGILRDALHTESVPANRVDWEALLNSLPSVTTVHRELMMEALALTPEAVLGKHERRSIVLFNQVRRAQDFYRRILDRARARGIEVILLHSRFFKTDRRAKEDSLRSLFGKGSQANAILVATQVVEAGVDVSCEHLHTELCPMNSLAQRAGRCARYEGQSGTVHVYSLPDEKAAWLPYGEDNEPLKTPSGTLTATQKLLAEIQSVVLTSTLIDDCVQTVHCGEDEMATHSGWLPRFNECLRSIEDVAVHREDATVAHLIRGSDENQVRLIISRSPNRPGVPGEREGLSVRRSSLFRLLQGPVQPVGWCWDVVSEEPGWKAIETAGDIAQSYVICLRPEVSAYDDSLGLRIGESGTQESPARQEPPRPGVSAIRREPWPDHAVRVADECQRRIQMEGDEGLLPWGMWRRYHLDAQAICRMGRACGLLHDVGKLQIAWDTWAAAYQHAKDPLYQHVIPLAHTDFDASDQRDWEIQRTLRLRRPPHASSSSYYGTSFFSGLLTGLPDIPRAVSACTAAVLGHHGGWLADIGPLVNRAPILVATTVAYGVQPERWIVTASCEDKQEATLKLLNLTMSGDELGNWWPLVAYLTRILRLSDQQATSEATKDD
jgi:CRISPR-associated endonuclease/helicase Cas3